MKSVLPKSVFAGVSISKTSITISVRTRKKIFFKEKFSVGIEPVSTLLAYIREVSARRNIVFIACGFTENSYRNEAANQLWIYENISPFFINIKNLDKISEIVSGFFDENNSYHAQTKNGQVITPFLASLDNYEKITPPSKFRKILGLTKKLKGKKISYFSATPQGGGVALMRHALLRFYNLIGVDAKWYVMDEDPDVFYITKNKFHNVFQNVNSKGVSLSKSDIKIFEKWSSKNYQKYKKVVANSDIVVIDDPQPAGMVPLIQKDFKNKIIIFRLHIHMLSKLAEKTGTEQYISWQYLHNLIRTTDMFIAHPIKTFVPKNAVREKVVFMGAVTDHFDGLNKHLTEKQQSYYTQIINNLLLFSGQSPLDLTRPIIAQVARFDPSKGIPDVLDAYLKLRNKLKENDGNAPQLVIAGNASVDDPDGTPVYQLASEISAGKKYKDFKDDIKILRVPHNDFLLNTIMRISTIYLQLSHKEGFEDKVTGALMKGKPVIIYNAGGMPLQIKDKISGFIANTGNTDQVFNYLFDLLTDKKLYHRMKINTIDNINSDMNTQTNALYWLYLFTELLSGRRQFGSQKLIDMVKF